MLTEDTFPEVNRERLLLVRRYMHGFGLTRKERYRLDELDAEVGAYARTRFPVPPGESIEAILERVNEVNTDAGLRDSL